MRIAEVMGGREGEGARDCVRVERDGGEVRCEKDGVT